MIEQKSALFTKKNNEAMKTRNKAC